MPTAPAIQPVVTRQLQPLWDLEAQTLATLPTPPGTQELHRDRATGVSWTKRTTSASLVTYVATDPALAYDKVMDFYARALPADGWTVQRGVRPDRAATALRPRGPRRMDPAPEKH